MCVCVCAQEYTFGVFRDVSGRLGTSRDFSGRLGTLCARPEITTQKFRGRRAQCPEFGTMFRDSVVQCPEFVLTFGTIFGRSSNVPNWSRINPNFRDFFRDTLKSPESCLTSPEKVPKKSRIVSNKSRNVSNKSRKSPETCLIVPKKVPKKVPKRAKGSREKGPVGIRDAF